MLILITTLIGFSSNATLDCYYFAQINCTDIKISMNYINNECYSLSDSGSISIIIHDPLFVINLFPNSGHCNNLPIITNFYTIGKCYPYGHLQSFICFDS